jgi:alpha-tubulin suppressor-like RCC1 family protein
MAGSSSTAGLLDLPLEVLTCICRHLDLYALVRVAETCKRLRHGDGGPETADDLAPACKRLRLGDGGLGTVELPTESPVVTALRVLASPGGVGNPSTHPIGSSESWVAYLARCAQQRRCREAPLIAAGENHSVFVDAAGRLLACGKGAAAVHGDKDGVIPHPTLLAAMDGVRVRSVAAGDRHSLGLCWDGRVYSWGHNSHGQLGHGDKLARPSPMLVEGLEGVRSLAAGARHSLAATHSGAVFRWGHAFHPQYIIPLSPIIVEGFGEVRVRRVCAGGYTAFAIGEGGELFSWGAGCNGILGHKDQNDQPSPKRVEALRGVRVSSVSVGYRHALALTEDGLVYAWGVFSYRAFFGPLHIGQDLLPKPIQTLRSVRVGSIAAAHYRSYAVDDTGAVWAWEGEFHGDGATPLGHGEEVDCLLPKPIASLRGFKVDAVAANDHHTLAPADDGSVYAWGSKGAANPGALGLGPTVSEAGQPVLTPQRAPVLRV